MLEPEEVADTGPAEFGLDPPRLSIALEDARGAVLEADFGAHNTDGLLQYMRLRDRAELYLMSGFVGGNGRPSSGAGRTTRRKRRDLWCRSRSTTSPQSRSSRAASYRFERDATGAWLYRHAPGDDPSMLHRADPAQSERIAQALAAFGRTPIERSVARGERGDAYGLVNPETIIVLFTKDAARPSLSFTSATSHRTASAATS